MQRQNRSQKRSFSRDVSGSGRAPPEQIKAAFWKIGLLQGDRLNRFSRAHAQRQYPLRTSGLGQIDFLSLVI